MEKTEIESAIKCLAGIAELPHLRKIVSSTIRAICLQVVDGYAINAMDW